MGGAAEVKAREWYAEYGECVLADASEGAISVVLPSPTSHIDFLPSCDELSRLKDYMKMVESMYVYVMKVDTTPNEVVVVAPQSKIDGGEKVVLKKQFEKVLLTTDGENWYIM